LLPVAVRKLSILHTESSLGWGGQEIRILSEAQGLIGRGHDVRLACPAEARIYAEAARWGVPVSPLPIAKKRLRGLLALRDWLRRHPCDLVSTHSSTDSWLVALAALYLGRRLPVVRTRHISAPVSAGWATRWLYGRAADRIVTTGEALRRQLIDENGLRPGKIESVPTGIDPDRFVPGDRHDVRRRLNLPQDLRLVGIVATLRSWKGHHVLIEAITGMPAEVGLVIVGDGPRREKLEHMVDQHTLRSRVWFAGNQDDVRPWLHAFDVFALPSLANEGVPQALVQAMMSGIPCVTTDIGGIPELAQHESTALVVAPHDSGALGAALSRLLADRGLARRLSGAARDNCVRNFSRQHMLERMERIYAAVCAGGAP